MEWVRDRAVVVMLAVFVVLVAASTAVSTIALVKTVDLANPSDREVIERLQRGVDRMSPREAEAIIGVMQRKAARAR